jgi:MYXO-CTERM domain-containing protein
VTFAGGGLTATGAPIEIGTAASFEQGPAVGGTSTHRDIAGGEAIVSTTSVDEPSTIALAGIAALAGLLGVRRRRRA